MPDMLAKILLVEDDPVLRLSLSAALLDVGYVVRHAEDGFLALCEIRHNMPKILISDLHMPNMSGYELLSVVRRRFPAILTIAMSGAPLEDHKSDGITADAFYAKGGGLRTLLQILQTLQFTEPRSANASSAAEPMWIHRSTNTSPPDAHVTIACPECLRTFLQALDGLDSRTQKTACIYCHTPIHFILSPSASKKPASVLQSITNETDPALKISTQYYYY